MKLVSQIDATGIWPPFTRKLVVALALLTSLLLLLLSLNMRPIADDYCYANDVGRGLLSALKNRYTGAGGNLFETAIVLIQTGLPLIILNAQWGSALSFLLTVTAVVCLVRTVFGLLVPRHSQLVLWSLSLIVGSFSWLTFWWFPALFPVLERMRPVFMRTAKDVVFWQSMTSQYVTVPAILALVLIWVFTARARRRLRLVISVLVGLFFGTSSLILAGGILIVSFVTLFASAKMLSLKAHRLSIAAIVSGCISGTLFQLLAPGTAQRYISIHSSKTPAPGDGLVSHLLRGLGQAPFWLAVEIMNVGVVFAFCLGVCVSSVMRRNANDFGIRSATHLAVVFGALAVALTISEKIMETYSYFALWHMTYSRFFIFLASLLLGTISFRFHSRFSIGIYVEKISIVLVIAGMVWATLSVGQLALTRAATWQSHRTAQGDAAETNSAWVMECALQSGLVSRN
jgi:hypothetical protein